MNIRITKQDESNNNNKHTILNKTVLHMLIHTEIIKCIQELCNIFKHTSFTVRPLSGNAESATIMVPVNVERIYYTPQMGATGSFRMSVQFSYHISISVRLTVKCAR
jgi:hypothetical protein